MFTRIQSHYQKVRAFYKKYESFFMPALIIWGFIYHYFTFKIIPIDDVLYLVFAYLGLATIVIIFVHFYDMGKITEKLRYVRLFSPLALQFAIGSMIGGVFIFYWFSGSVFVSWPFILLVVVLIVSLEAYKHYLENPIVQFALYCFAAFLLLAVALPYFFKSINPWLFIFSGIISFLLVLVLMWLLRYSEPVIKYRYRIISVCALVLAIMFTFYFYNLIPPVPLSIRDAGIYHDVRSSGNEYVLVGEKESFWQKFKPTPTIHLPQFEPAFMFTSIYSPSDLNTEIIHDWQYYDPAQKKWVSMSKVSFQVIGGRQEGYRGYSYKSYMPEGKWRVYIETPRGQVLGRYQFNLKRVDQEPVLKQEVK